MTEETTRINLSEESAERRKAAFMIIKEALELNGVNTYAAIDAMLSLVAYIVKEAGKSKEQYFSGMMHAMQGYAKNLWGDNE